VRFHPNPTDSWLHKALLRFSWCQRSDRVTIGESYWIANGREWIVAHYPCAPRCP